MASHPTLILRPNGLPAEGGMPSTRLQANAGRTPSSGPYGINSTLWADFLGVAESGAGVAVTEKSAMGLPAFYRGVCIIAGSIGSLPLKSYRDSPDGTRARVPSVFDDPGSLIDMFPSEWRALHATWMAIHGETFMRHRFNGVGELVGLDPVHPLAVSKVERTDEGRKQFTMSLAGGGSKIFGTGQMTQVIRLSLDGLRGVSPITVLREAIGSGIASQRAATRMFKNGQLIGGVLTSDDPDLEDDDARQMVEEVRQQTAGVDRAGDIAFLNAKLKFTPWSMTAADAQFLESREFSITDVARILGIPPHLLAQTEKQTSWGQGVTEQNRGLARFTLVHYTDPLEEACASLVGPTDFTEFDFAKLLKPTPEEERTSIIAQIQGGLITANEGRAILNLPPIEGGDELRVSSWLISEENR